MSHLHCGVLYALVIAVPLVLASLVWESYRYDALDSKSQDLLEQQQNWIESNQRLIAGIAVLSSPERIEQIATREMGLQKIKPQDILQIHLEDQNGSTQSLAAGDGGGGANG
jgi:cell division protein FtsL